MEVHACFRRRQPKISIVLYQGPSPHLPEGQMHELVILVHPWGLLSVGESQVSGVCQLANEEHQRCLWLKLLVEGVGKSRERSNIAFIHNLLIYDGIMTDGLVFSLVWIIRELTFGNASAMKIRFSCCWPWVVVDVVISKSSKYFL